MTERLDLQTWPRAWLVHHFTGYAQPHFTITSRLDASRLVAARQHARSVGADVSLYRACLYAIGVAANQVEAFRLRLVPLESGWGVDRYPSIDVSSTIAAKDANFGFGYTDFVADWPTFDAASAAADERARAGELPPGVAERRDVLYASCVPWVDIHGMTHALAGPDDDVPRVSWGRIVEREGRHEFGCCVAVHHALVTGGDVAAFFLAIQSALDHTDFTAVATEADSTRP